MVGVYFSECPLCDFTLFFVLIVVAVIVIRIGHSGKDEWVKIPMVIIICFPEGGAGVGWDFFAQLSCIICRCHSRIYSRQEAFFIFIMSPC